MGIQSLTWLMSAKTLQLIATAIVVQALCFHGNYTGIENQIHD